MMFQLEVENEDIQKIFWKHKIKKFRDADKLRWLEQGCTCFLGHPPCGYCTREIDNEDN